MKDERLEAIIHWWEEVYDEEMRTAIYLFCNGMANHVEDEAQRRRAEFRITE